MIRTRQVSQRSKKAKWLQWCATIYLGQLWRSVCTATGAASPGQHLSAQLRGRSRLADTGQSNQIDRVRRALNLITTKCEELVIKISADKSRAMNPRAAS